jgi:class 3 adenylate cyclase/tetratricopeptide (TPR) repeat protein
VSDGSIDELLDRAVAAINRGDRATATALAGQVLAVDHGNVDAEDLLTAPGSAGEIRRLTIVFADLVDSTALSTAVEPETYRTLVGRYREQVRAIVDRFEGHIGSVSGDGMLAVFGHPRAHEDDVRRAVAAGLEITRAVSELSDQAQRRIGIEITVRVGVHRGLVYLDTAQDDVYGLAANLAARVSALAPPGTVVVSDAVAPLITARFTLAAHPPAAVKGVAGLVGYHQVVGEWPEPAKANRGPLVGRDRELGRLQKSWARAQAGTLTTPGVAFRGEPGIGKSRLAAAAAELVEDSGGVTLELIGSPFHTDAGLHPVRALLERRCGIDRGTAQIVRLRLLEAEVGAQSLDPDTVVPLLAPVLGIGAEAGYRPVPAEGRKLYELIAQAVQTYLLACLDGAGLVVAEDVHWFDPSTLEILGALLNAGGGRLLVVVTGRDGGWLTDGWPVKVFDLAPLTVEQTNELIGALNPALTASTRAQVADRCDGVPFYIEQVVADLTDSGVPEALYDSLFARLRASANAVPVLEAAAIIGRQVERSLLCSVVDLSDDEVDDVIDELEEALVLEPRSADSWRFRHELLREVAAELAPPSVRRDLHARVADALACGADPDWHLVAAHYERAGKLEEAASAYQQASTAARHRGAVAEARTDLTLALSGLEHATAGRNRDSREIALRLERGFLAAIVEGAQSPAAAADFERCLQLTGADLRDDELVPTLLAVTVYYFMRADLRRAGRAHEVLRTTLGEKGSQWFRPILEIGWGLMAFLRGEFDDAHAHLEAAAAGQSAEDRRELDAVWFVPGDQITNAHIHLGVIGFVRGDLAVAKAELARAAGRAEQLGFPQGPFSMAFTRSFEVRVCIEAGQLDQAALLAADLIERAEQHGFDLWMLFGASLQANVAGMAALCADDLDPRSLGDHIATITALLDGWRALEVNMYRTFFDAYAGRLLTAAGRLDEARAYLDTSLQLAENTGMCFYNAELLRLRANTHTEPDARRADLAVALELARRQGATLFELRAALDDFEFRGPPARAALIDAASRIPADNAWPELALAHTRLAVHWPGT